MILKHISHHQIADFEHVYLQDEGEVVDGFSSLVEEVLRRTFVAVVELEILDNVRVSEDPQQDSLRDLERAEQGHLWGGGEIKCQYSVQH